MQNPRVCPYCGRSQTEYTGKTTDRAHNKIEIYHCLNCDENHLVVNAQSRNSFTIPAEKVSR